MSRLGISKGRIQETFSVCKVVNVNKRSPAYLSTYVLIYANMTGITTIVDIEIERKTVKRIRKKFCGFGPHSFDEILEESRRNFDEGGKNIVLICRENLGTPQDALDFITGHLWADQEVERPEAMGAYEDVGEMMLACLGIRRDG